MSQARSFLFIPDISGFTEFVNETEVSHSQHIISELLELIIDANELGMTVAEIEGDAVLFYKEGEVPDVSKIIGQSREMFVRFHTYLKRYDERKICQCGACSSASKLSLKFIAHAGDFGFIKVKEYNKPYGPDVILAHKLMKNDIDSREYLVFTHKFFQSDEKVSGSPDWAKVQHGETNYVDFGKIDYSYIELKSLHKEIPATTHLEKPSLDENPIRKEITIKASIETVQSYISELRFRKDWVQGVKEIKELGNSLNQEGGRHICVFDDDTVVLETFKPGKNKGKWSYAEKVVEPKMFKQMVNYFFLDKKGEKVCLVAEVHLMPKNFLGSLLFPFYKKKIYSRLEANLASLKKLCEQ